MDKYILERSETTPCGWVLTDTENRIVVRFIEHQFNETQKVTMLEDSTANAEDLARIMREIGDWMFRNHYNVAMKPQVHIAYDEETYSVIKRIKSPTFEIRITEKTDVHLLAQNLRRCAAWLDSIVRDQQT